MQRQGAELRVAICYICYGERTAAAARLSIASLVEQGFNGDVVLLTDAVRTYPDGVDVLQRILPQRVINIDPEADFMAAEIDCRDLANPADRGRTIQQLSPMVYRWLDLERYDLVIVLDVDILANRDVMECADALMRRGSMFGVGLGKLRLKSTPASNEYLTWFERLRWGREKCINSGFVYFRPSRIAMRILKTWEAATLRRARGDQAALQAVYLRHFRDEIDVTPYAFQDFGPLAKKYSGRPEELVRSEGYFVHFRGAVRAPQVMYDYAALFLPATLASARAVAPGADLSPEGGTPRTG